MHNVSTEASGLSIRVVDALPDHGNCAARKALLAAHLHPQVPSSATFDGGFYGTLLPHRFPVVADPGRASTARVIGLGDLIAPYDAHGGDASQLRCDWYGNDATSTAKALPILTPTPTTTPPSTVSVTGPGDTPSAAPLTVRGPLGYHPPQPGSATAFERPELALERTYAVPLPLIRQHALSPMVTEGSTAGTGAGDGRVAAAIGFDEGRDQGTLPDVLLTLTTVHPLEMAVPKYHGGLAQTLAMGEAACTSGRAPAHPCEDPLPDALEDAAHHTLTDDRYRADRSRGFKVALPRTTTQIAHHGILAGADTVTVFVFRNPYRAYTHFFAEWVRGLHGSAVTRAGDDTTGERPSLQSDANDGTRRQSKGVAYSQRPLQFFAPYLAAMQDRGCLVLHLCLEDPTPDAARLRLVQEECALDECLFRHRMGSHAMYVTPHDLCHRHVRDRLSKWFPNLMLQRTNLKEDRAKGTDFSDPIEAVVHSNHFYCALRLDCFIAELRAPTVSTYSDGEKKVAASFEFSALPPYPLLGPPPHGTAIHPWSEEGMQRLDEWDAAVHDTVLGPTLALTTAGTKCAELPGLRFSHDASQLRDLALGMKVEMHRRRTSRLAADRYSCRFMTRAELEHDLVGLPLLDHSRRTSARRHHADSQFCKALQHGYARAASTDSDGDNNIRTPGSATDDYCWRRQPPTMPDVERWAPQCVNEAWVERFNADPSLLPPGQTDGGVQLVSMALSPTIVVVQERRVVPKQGPETATAADGQLSVAVLDPAALPFTVSLACAMAHHTFRLDQQLAPFIATAPMGLLLSPSVPPTRQWPWLRRPTCNLVIHAVNLSAQTLECTVTEGVAARGSLLDLGTDATIGRHTITAISPSAPRAVASLKSQGPLSSQPSARRAAMPPMEALRRIGGAAGVRDWDHTTDAVKILSEKTLWPAEADTNHPSPNAVKAGVLKALAVLLRDEMEADRRAVLLAAPMPQLPLPFDQAEAEQDHVFTTALQEILKEVSEEARSMAEDSEPPAATAASILRSLRLVEAPVRLLRGHRTLEHYWSYCRHDSNNSSGSAVLWCPDCPFSIPPAQLSESGYRPHASFPGLAGPRLGSFADPFVGHDACLQRYLADRSRTMALVCWLLKGAATTDLVADFADLVAAAWTVVNHVSLQSRLMSLVTWSGAMMDNPRLLSAHHPPLPHVVLEHRADRRDLWKRAARSPYMPPAEAFPVHSRVTVSVTGFHQLLRALYAQHAVWHCVAEAVVVTSKRQFSTSSSHTSLCAESTLIGVDFCPHTATRTPMRSKDLESMYCERTMLPLGAHQTRGSSGLPVLAGGSHDPRYVMAGPTTTRHFALLTPLGPRDGAHAHPSLWEALRSPPTLPSGQPDLSAAIQSRLTSSDKEPHAVLHFAHATKRSDVQRVRVGSVVRIGRQAFVEGDNEAPPPAWSKAVVDGELQITTGDFHSCTVVGSVASGVAVGFEQPMHIVAALDEKTRQGDHSSGHCLVLCEAMAGAAVVTGSASLRVPLHIGCENAALLPLPLWASATAPNAPGVSADGWLFPLCGSGALRRSFLQEMHAMLVSNTFGLSKSPHPILQRSHARVAAAMLERPFAGLYELPPYSPAHKAHAGDNTSCTPFAFRQRDMCTLYCGAHVGEGRDVLAVLPSVRCTIDPFFDFYPYHESFMDLQKVSPDLKVDAQTQPLVSHEPVHAHTAVNNGLWFQPSPLMLQRRHRDVTAQLFEVMLRPSGRFSNPPQKDIVLPEEAFNRVEPMGNVPVPKATDPPTPTNTEVARLTPLLDAFFRGTDHEGVICATPHAYSPSAAVFPTRDLDARFVSCFRRTRLSGRFCTPTAIHNPLPERVVGPQTAPFRDRDSLVSRHAYALASGFAAQNLSIPADVLGDSIAFMDRILRAICFDAVLVEKRHAYKPQNSFENSFRETVCYDTLFPSELQIVSSGGANCQLLAEWVGERSTEHRAVLAADATPDASPFCVATRTVGIAPPPVAGTAGSGPSSAPTMTAIRTLPSTARWSLRSLITGRDDLVSVRTEVGEYLAPVAHALDAQHRQWLRARLSPTASGLPSAPASPPPCCVPPWFLERFGHLLTRVAVAHNLKGAFLGLCRRAQSSPTPAPTPQHRPLFFPLDAHALAMIRENEALLASEYTAASVLKETPVCHYSPSCPRSVHTARAAVSSNLRADVRLWTQELSSLHPAGAQWGSSFKPPVNRQCTLGPGEVLCASGGWSLGGITSQYHLLQTLQSTGALSHLAATTLQTLFVHYHVLAATLATTVGADRALMRATGLVHETQYTTTYTTLDTECKRRKNCEQLAQNMLPLEGESSLTALVTFLAKPATESTQRSLCAACEYEGMRSSTSPLLTWHYPNSDGILETLYKDTALISRNSTLMNSTPQTPTKSIFHHLLLYCLPQDTPLSSKNAALLPADRRRYLLRLLDRLRLLSPPYVFASIIPTVAGYALNPNLDQRVKHHIRIAAATANSQTVPTPTPAPDRDALMRREAVDPLYHLANVRTAPFYFLFLALETGAALARLTWTSSHSSRSSGDDAETVAVALPRQVFELIMAFVCGPHLLPALHAATTTIREYGPLRQYK